MTRGNKNMTTQKPQTPDAVADGDATQKAIKPVIKQEPVATIRVDPRFVELPSTRPPSSGAKKSQESVVLTSAGFSGYELLPVVYDGTWIPELGTRFAPGFYIITGGAGKGKTLSTMAMLHTIALSMGTSYRGLYMYMFEARAPSPSRTWTRRATDAEIGAKLRSVTSDGMIDMFASPHTFLNDMQDIIGKLSPNKERAFIVADSVTLPMRLHDVQARPGSSAGEKGMMTQDIEFAVFLNNMCANNNVTLFGPVNDELTAFASKLEGMTEGFINVEAPGLLTKTDRVLRSEELITIPKASVDLCALSVLKYNRQEPIARPSASLISTMANF